jgi:hypothetical protein
VLAPGLLLLGAAMALGGHRRWSALP